MAKKTKTIEIKAVPAEPQRGAGQDASLDDPVGIYYPFGGIARLIGSLAGGDEDQAVIKTGGTIVEHDINVRYHAEGPSIVNVPIYSYMQGAAEGKLIKNTNGYPGSRCTIMYNEIDEANFEVTAIVVNGTDFNDFLPFTVTEQPLGAPTLIDFVIPDLVHYTADQENPIERIIIQLNAK